MSEDTLLYNILSEAGLRLAEDNEPGAFWLFVRVASEVLAVWVIEAEPDYAYGSTIRENVGLGVGVDY